MCNKFHLARRMLRAPRALGVARALGAARRGGEPSDPGCARGVRAPGADAPRAEHPESRQKSPSAPVSPPLAGATPETARARRGGAAREARAREARPIDLSPSPLRSAAPIARARLTPPPFVRSHQPPSPQVHHRSRWPPPSS